MTSEHVCSPGLHKRKTGWDEGNLMLLVEEGNDIHMGEIETIGE